jgi:hypothetical protein
MNDNRELFEVPGMYENPRRQTPTLAFTVYVKCPSSLEARNIRFVNSNLSKVQESKLIPAS